MNAIKYIVFAIFGVTSVLAIWLYYENQAAEKVATAFWTALAVSAIGTLVSVIFTLKAESKADEVKDHVMKVSGTFNDGKKDHTVTKSTKVTINKK